MEYSAAQSLELLPLPIQRPLLMIGHGTTDAQGKQALLNFAATYEALDPSRPVVPCFLELTTPTIQEGVEQCVERGYVDLSVLPVLLFAGLHNKFQVTNELDAAKARYPHLKFHYGRHFGITPRIIELWRLRLVQLDDPEYNPEQISRVDTVVLFVGCGSSEPDANEDVYKIARILQQGSGYSMVETCFIVITHPQLEEGFRRARAHQPKRIIVLPYLLFTGALMKKIVKSAVKQQEEYPDISIICLPEMGLHPQLFLILREREIETQQEPG
jgi:sirohydrochlorin cobaltochelatase